MSQSPLSGSEKPVGRVLPLSETPWVSTCSGSLALSSLSAADAHSHPVHTFIVGRSDLALPLFGSGPKKQYAPSYV